MDGCRVASVVMAHCGSHCARQSGVSSQARMERLTPTLSPKPVIPPIEKVLRVPALQPSLAAAHLKLSPSCAIVHGPSRSRPVHRSCSRSIAPLRSLPPQLLRVCVQCVRVCAHVRVCVRVCVRACVAARVHLHPSACMHGFFGSQWSATATRPHIPPLAVNTDYHTRAPPASASPALSRVPIHF
jgi:hypothetical protein